MVFTVDSFEAKDLLDVMQLASRVLPERYPYEFFLQMARAQGQYFRVAREQETGRIAGFIVAAKQPGLQGRVLVFGVDPALQGRGLGRLLLRDIQRSLTLEDVRSLQLEVRPDNRRAISFYQHEGFAVTGLQERAYKDGSDALWMAKALF